MLQDSFRAVEIQMKAKLAEVRAAFAHSGNKGSQVEAAFREFLRKYLARRLSVGQGEIVDTLGKRSGQVDVVVADEDHPFTFDQDQPGLFFVEGVCAVGEVKSLLTSDELGRSIESGRKVKQLKVRELNGSMSFSEPEDQDRFYLRRPFFLVAMESQLTLENVAKTIAADRTIDAAFLLDRGWVIDFGTGQGSFKFSPTGGIEPGGPSQPGVQSFKSDQVLFDLMTWLSVSMPRVVRFQSILPLYLLGGADVGG